jgi:hypothetical protein
MNFRTTFILLILLVGAGVAVYFTNKSKPADDTQQSTDTSGTTAGKKLLSISTSDITKLSIQPADGKRIVLQRAGLGWHMLEPVDAPADMDTPSSILSDLDALTSTGKVSTSGADAAATGLTPPQFQLELTDKSGKSTKLDIGARSGTGDQLYVHLDGADQDDLVQADVYDLLDKPWTDFRQKKLLTVNQTDVQSVQVDRPEGHLLLQKIGDNWFIKKPSIMPGDTSAITDVVLGLTGLQASQFVAETDPNPARYGLDNPVLTVTYSASAGGTASTQPTTNLSQTVVKFGIEDVRKQNVYVSTSNSTAVALVPVSSMDAFKKTALDLRDKQLLNIDPATVSGITIKTSLPATTQPTTRPASETIVTLDRRPVSPTTAPATSPATTTASTQPVVKHSIWEVISQHPAIDAGDGKVTALLAALHPLKVNQYDAAPTTAPATADQYTLTIQCPPPLISSYTLELTDPGNSQPLIGRYNDLNFEVDRSLLDKIKADFTKPDDTTVNTTPAPSVSPGSGSFGP